MTQIARIAPLSLVLALAMLVAAGCEKTRAEKIAAADTPDELAELMITTFEEIGNQLAGIKDKASAEAAKPKLQALAADMKSLTAKTNTIKADPEKDKQLEAKYGERLKAAMQKMMTEGIRIESNPDTAGSMPDFD